MVEVEFEEESYSKIIIIILGILVIIIIGFILDIMSGGTLVKEILCAILWWVPIYGHTLTLYLKCGTIPV